LDFDYRDADGSMTGTPGTLLFVLAHHRARAYNLLHGRWMQRDPAEYVDGMNLYEYVRSIPATYVDPSALEWWIERSANKSRASVTNSECSDTIDDLAALTRMDPQNYKIWLDPKDGGGRPNSSSDAIGMLFRDFSIPNQIVVAVGDMNTLARGLTGNTPASAYELLLSKGFAVRYLDYDYVGPFTSGDITKCGYDLYGIVFWGHGLSDGSGKKKWTGILDGKTDAGALMITATELVSASLFYKGQFGLLALKSCFASETWPSRLSPNGVGWFGRGFELASFDFGLWEAVEGAR